MKRATASFDADEDPSGLFDEALDAAALEDDAALAEEDSADFELDLRMLSAARRHARMARRPGQR